jgi:hypothetical protein
MAKIIPKFPKASLFFGSNNVWDYTKSRWDENINFRVSEESKYGLI